MSPAAPDPRARPAAQPPRERYEFRGGEAETRIAPGAATLALGGFALLVAGASWTGPLGWLAWFDLPLTFALFLFGAWISLSDPRATTRALPGLLVGVAAVLLATIHLFASPTHPWLR